MYIISSQSSREVLFVRTGEGSKTCATSQMVLGVSNQSNADGIPFINGGHLQHLGHVVTSDRSKEKDQLGSSERSLLTAAE